MSDEENFEYYLIEAEQNNARTQYSLGVMYDNGEGVEQNYGKAFEWYTKAADQGDENAIEVLERLK